MRAAEPKIAEAWGKSTIARVIAVVATLYLIGIWMDAVMPSTLDKRVEKGQLPRPVLYFLQIAALFPRAATMAIDYRAEGYICSQKKWVEIDVRPFFLIDRDDKESRFQRVMHFYKEDRRTMQALERYVIDSYNANAGTGEKIVGTRFSSLRIPLPKPAEHVERTVWKPISEHAPSVEKHDWYWTKRSVRGAACGAEVPE